LTTKKQSFEASVCPDFISSLRLFDEVKPDQAAPADPAGDRIAKLARMSFAELAEEYRAEIESAKSGQNGGSEMADMIDSIAVVRFGMGFYQGLS